MNTLKTYFHLLKNSRFDTICEITQEPQDGTRDRIVPVGLSIRQSGLTKYQQLLSKRNYKLVKKSSLPLLKVNIFQNLLNIEQIRVLQEQQTHPAFFDTKFVKIG